MVVGETDQGEEWPEEEREGFISCERVKLNVCSKMIETMRYYTIYLANM